MNLFCSFEPRTKPRMPSSFFQTFLVLFCTHLLLLTPGRAISQKVNADFSDVVFTDDFSEDKGLWIVKSDADNLFLIQNNEYLLKRINKETEMAVTCKWKNPCAPFELKTYLKLDKISGTRSYAGVFFMMQENKTGGFLLEMNTKKQVRIRQVIHGNYRLITGSPESQGWIPASSATSNGTYNLIRIAYAEKNYDVYLNETLLKSFTELAYKNGDFGFIVGPGAVVHADFISVSTVTGCALKEEDKKTEVQLKPIAPDTASMLRRLQDENQRLKSENRILRDSLNQKNN